MPTSTMNILASPLPFKQDNTLARGHEYMLSARALMNAFVETRENSGLPIHAPCQIVLFYMEKTAVLVLAP